MKLCKYFLILVLLTAVSYGGDFKVGIADSMQKIRDDRVGLENVSFAETVFLDAAKDESESFQLIIIPESAEVKDLKVVCDDSEFKANNIRLRWHKVGYVKTGNPCYSVEHVGRWPDPLLPAETINVGKDKVQPLWFSAVTSANTKAGVYDAKIVLTCGRQKSEIDIQLRVRNFVIPRPGTLATPFGLYRKVIEDWYYGKQGTLAKEDFDRWCRFLCEYRLTPKNIGYEYVEKQYETINDEKTLTGVDMSQLEPILKELSNEYFSPYSFAIYRLPSGPTVEKALKNDYAWCTPEKVAQPVKLHFDQWQKNGFNDQVYVYGVDEAVGEESLKFLHETYGFIKEAVPSCKIMQTGLCNKPELVGLVDIWCPKTEITWDKFFQERLAGGDILWTYVCCSPVPPHANFFVDEPAIDHRVLFWQTKQVNATGLLYWTVIWHAGTEAKAHTGKPCFPDIEWDFTESNLFTDTWVHVNGDGVLIYPGKNLQPLSSIRLEVVRDGIEDYEYLALLETLVEQVAALKQYQTKGTKPLIARARELAKVPDFISSGPIDYTHEPGVISKRRIQIADMIEQLNDVLSNKDYLKWKN